MELGGRNHSVIAIVADRKLGSTERRQTLSDRSDENWPGGVYGRFSTIALFKGAAAQFVSAFTAYWAPCVGSSDQCPTSGEATLVGAWE